jgi:plasmid replication initiation protein
MAKLIQIDGNGEVKKADVVVKARYKLNPLSLKFITSIISGIKRSDDINEEYQFKVKDFKELTGLKRKDLYSSIKEVLKELLEKPLYIPKEKNEKDNSFLMLNWVASAEYKEGEGLIEFEISNKLRPYLLEAQKRFLKYKLENILSLKSSYSIRMYEILKDWLELNSRYGKKTEKIVSIKEFKETLEVPGSYRFNNIKVQILEKSKNEIQQNTDIMFEYEEIKTGRKVTHLKLFIRPNPTKLQENNNQKINKIFKTRASFIRFLRENYSGNGKMFGFKTIDKKIYWLGINNKGLMYATLSNEIRNLNSSESLDIYNIWFKIAQNSELYQELINNKVCLQELQKTNKSKIIDLNYEIKLFQDQGII